MGRLKGIPAILSPDILHLLSVTGHGDEIVLADINFPTHTICQGVDSPKQYRADGVKATDLLEAILTLMPLDWYHEWQMAVMALTDQDVNRYGRDLAPIVETYESIANEHEGHADEAGNIQGVTVHPLERFAFYKRVKSCYAIIHTGETAAYANVILKRGVC